MKYQFTVFTVLARKFYKSENLPFVQHLRSKTQIEPLWICKYEYGISLWWIWTHEKGEIDQRDRFSRFGISRKNSFGRYLRRSISSRSGLRLPPSKSQVEEGVAHYSLEVRASPETYRRRRKFAPLSSAVSGKLRRSFSLPICSNNSLKSIPILTFVQISS